MKTTRLLAGLAAVGFMLPVNAHAFGIGGYFEYGGGSSAKDIEYDISDFDGTLDINEERFHQLGFGVTIDTALAEDTLINYRAGLGLEFKDVDVELKGNGARCPEAVRDRLCKGNWESVGVVFDNALGFGIVRTPDLRLWLRPSLRLGADFYNGEDVAGDSGDRVDFLLGFGPEVGLNVNAGDYVTVAFTGGYQYQLVFSALDTNGDGDFNDDNSDGFDDTGNGAEHLGFLRVSVFYRIGDTF